MTLAAVTLAAAYGCSSAETERNPVYLLDTAAVGKACGGGSSLGTGGNASGGGASLGTGGKASGGANNNGSGGANNNGSGGANNASGGANNASDGASNAACTPTDAGVAAMLATHGCNDCHGRLQ